MKIGKVARMVKRLRAARVIRVGGRQWIDVGGLALYALDGVPQIRTGEELLAMLDVPAAEADYYSVGIAEASPEEEQLVTEDMSEDRAGTVGGILLGWSGGVYVPLVGDDGAVTWYSDKLTDPADAEGVVLRVAEVAGRRVVRMWRGLSLVAVIMAWEPTPDAVEAVQECMARGFGV